MKIAEINEKINFLMPKIRKILENEEAPEIEVIVQGERREIASPRPEPFLALIWCSPKKLEGAMLREVILSAAYSGPKNREDRIFSVNSLSVGRRFWRRVK